jgi:hypothetical protein
MNEGTVNLFLVLVFVLCLAIIAYGILEGNPLPCMFTATLLPMLAFYFALTLKLIMSIVLEKIEKMRDLKFYTPINWNRLTVYMLTYGWGAPSPLFFHCAGAGCKLCLFSYFVLARASIIFLAMLNSFR